MIKKILLFLSIVGLTACSDFSEDTIYNVKTLSSDDHRVELSDIAILNSCSNKGTRSSTDTKNEIICLTNEHKDTLLYVINKNEGGWTIYPSDTRVPTIVAQSDRGTFSDLMQIDGANLWIQSMIEDMSIIKNLPNDKLSFSRSEIERNKSFWKSIANPDSFIKEKIKSSSRKAPGDHELTIGHYELVATTSYYEIFDSIAPLTTTRWHQGSPYNRYCPYRTDLQNVHAYAGCVAIAGAQMLYFLHNLFGVPVSAPSEAYCYGNVDSPDYYWDQTNYTSNVWEAMNTYGSAAAPLIANVGNRVNMVYGNQGSEASTRDLVDNVFLPYGIACTYGAYNTATLCNSLLNGMPVIMRAIAEYQQDNTTKRDGHAFIIDRYQLAHQVTKNTYRWVYDSFPHKPLPYIPEEEVYTYSSPFVSRIGMNWGWGPDAYVPDEWFSLTGDWISSLPSMSIYNWNISREMIYGFRINNN